MCVFVIVIIRDNCCICYVWCAQGMYSYNSIIYHRLDFFLQKMKNVNLCKVVLFYPGKKRKIHNFLLVLCFTMCSYIFQTFFVNIACTIFKVVLDGAWFLMDVYSRLEMPGTLERETKNAPISDWLCQASAITNSHSIMHIQKDPYKYMYFDNQYQFYTSITLQIVTVLCAFRKIHISICTLTIYQFYTSIPVQIVTVLCAFRKIYIRILWKSISILYEYTITNSHSITVCTFRKIYIRILWKSISVLYEYTSTNSHSITVCTFRKIHIRKPWKSISVLYEYTSSNSYSIMHIQKDPYKNTLKININSIRVY